MRNLKVHPFRGFDLIAYLPAGSGFDETSLHPIQVYVSSIGTLYFHLSPVHLNLFSRSRQSLLMVNKRSKPVVVILKLREYISRGEF